MKVIKEWTIDDKHGYAVIQTDATFEPYVVAYLYHKDTKSWEQGHYFQDLNDAINCYICKIDPWRNREKYLLENAMSYMHDNDIISDFLWDRDISLTEDEIMYYFPNDIIMHCECEECE